MGKLCLSCGEGQGFVVGRLSTGLHGLGDAAHCRRWGRVWRCGKGATLVALHPMVVPYFTGTSQLWLGFAHHVGMLCAAQPPRGGAMVLAAAPATSAALNCASVKPLGCALASCRAMVCA